MRKIFLVLVCLLSWTLAVQAENVTGERAAEAASAFFRSAQAKGMKMASAVSLKMVMSSSAFSSSQSSDDPAFYVFNNTSGPGFVIIAGDDAVRPVLGYSFENNFPEGRTLPPSLSAWLEGTARGIDAVRKSGVRPAKSASDAWETAAPGTPVRKLETAKWDQADPYYRLCPEFGGELCITGCTATALAIVMRYHRWPKRGVGELPGYDTYSYHFWVDGVKLGHTYDWDNMPLRYYDDYDNPTFTDAEAEAVAVLMRDCGILMESDYSPWGTGAMTDDMDECLNDILKGCARILAPMNSFLVLNLYSNGYSAMLADTLVACAFGPAGRRTSGELVLKDDSGRILPLSVYTRLER